MGAVERLSITVLTAAPFMTLVFYVVTYLDRLQLELGQQAATDVLTGLPNRRAFMEQTALGLGYLSTAPRGVILLIDADHFKKINDSWGHAIGDTCLVAIAERIRKTLRSGDQIARIGGEEFAAFLPGVTMQEAVNIATRLSEPITMTPSDPPGRLRFTLSVGAAEVTEGMGLEDALNFADLALYRAKKAGRARLVPWDGQYRPGEGRAA